ncbi:MAG TPA: hypothetical protein VEX41_06825 [Candidatus Eisenbacteria bacterium]|nr:hypothetical protein [Candidatus Eisenbacteria bacterium]
MAPGALDPIRLIAAAFIGLTGVIFIAQGLGAPIGRSFMIGDMRWTAIGIVLVGVAAIVALLALRAAR